MIGRLQSLSFVNAQYVIDGSLVIITMMMIEMNGWLIETTILIQYHCKNGKENIIISQEGLIFDNHRIMLWDQESVWNKQTNKQSFHRNLPNQWLITELFSIIDLLLDLDKISENGRNIYECNQINQKILEIDFDRTLWNE